MKLDLPKSPDKSSPAPLSAPSTPKRKGSVRGFFSSFSSTPKGSPRKRSGKWIFGYLPQINFCLPKCNPIFSNFEEEKTTPKSKWKALSPRGNIPLRVLLTFTSPNLT